MPLDAEYESSRDRRHADAERKVDELRDELRAVRELLERYGPALHALAQQQRQPGVAAHLSSAFTAFAQSGALEALAENLGSHLAGAPRPTAKRRRNRRARDEY